MKRTWILSDIIIFKRCRARARRVILEAKSSSCTSLTSNTNLSKVWKVIKSFSGHRSSYFIPTLLAQGVSAKNKQHKSNMFANQFALFSSCQNYPPRDPTNPNATIVKCDVPYDANWSRSKSKFFPLMNFFSARTSHPDQTTLGRQHLLRNVRTYVHTYMAHVCTMPSLSRWSERRRHKNILRKVLIQRHCEYRQCTTQELSFQWHRVSPGQRFV